MDAILFLDIDGVLNIPNRSIGVDVKNAALCKEQWDGPTFLSPIPMVTSLLRAIDAEERIHPAWLSSWGCSAVRWNTWTGTRAWPVVYRITDEQTALYDSKLHAVCSYLCDYPKKHVTWVEDGFSAETRAWASERGYVKLVDTTDKETRSFLLAMHKDYGEASQEFIRKYL